MTDEDLHEELLDNYIYQKVKLLEDAGMQGAINTNRMRELVRPRIDKMLPVVKDWRLRPDVVMDAVFAWAKYNRHPDGPMPNMLYSQNYIAKALSNYLQVPYAVVMEKRSMALFFERMDFEFDRFRKELERAGVTDLSSATSYPLETRYLMAVSKLDWDDAFYMAQELLELMRKDPKVNLWLRHRGVTYEVVAKLFNKRKKQIK